MNITGLDKAEVLAALFNNSRQQGMGFMHANGRADITADEAREIIKEQGDYYDYLRGRVMKVDIAPKDGELWTALYNRDNGMNAAENALASLKKKETA